MAYYFWHGLDFQGSRVSGAFKVPKRIDAIKHSKLDTNGPYGNFSESFLLFKGVLALPEFLNLWIQKIPLKKSQIRFLI